MDLDPSSNEARALVRCPVCAVPWQDHPADTICARHRPYKAAWLEQVKAKIDDEEKARRELLGAVPPTSEWKPTTNGDTAHAPTTT